MIPISYIIALLPLYVLVYLPLSNILFGAPQKRSSANPNFILNSSFIATEDADLFNPHSCLPHSYETHILNHEPLIIYIENFLSAKEREHLISISEDKFQPSTISKGSNTTIDQSIRFSEVALLDRDDTVRCIEHRARSFQGWRQNLYIERLRTQRYGVGGHYRHHFDWSGASREQDRVSTFMVYVDTKELVGGGTEFPSLKGRKDGRWCEFLECEKEEDERDEKNNEGLKEKKKVVGLTFKAKAGNAVYWVNIAPDGRGYEETWHAGLPVEAGEKIGLNIWSWGSARGQ